MDASSAWTLWVAAAGGLTWLAYNHFRSFLRLMWAVDILNAVLLVFSLTVGWMIGRITGWLASTNINGVSEEARLRTAIAITNEFNHADPTILMILLLTGYTMFLRTFPLWMDKIKSDLATRPDMLNK